MTDSRGDVTCAHPSLARLPPLWTRTSRASVYAHLACAFRVCRCEEAFFWLRDVLSGAVTAKFDVLVVVGHGEFT
jgi:hypothetical protein